MIVGFDEPPNANQPRTFPLQYSAMPNENEVLIGMATK